MKISLPRADLLDVVIRGLLPLKIDPSLFTTFVGHGKITVAGSKLYVQSLGQTVAARVFIHVDDDDSSDGSASFSIDDMANLIKFFPKGENVVMEKRVTEDDPTGKVVIKAGKSKLVLPCIHDEVYNDVEMADGDPVMSCDKESLINAVAAVVSYGMPKDADRVRSNVCFRPLGDKTYVGATDGIACCYRLVPETSLDGVLHLPIPVSKSLSKFLKDGDVVFYAGEKHMYISQERGFMRVSVPQGIAKFPDYTKLMDAPQEGAVSVSRENLLQLMQACKQVNPEEAMMTVSDGKVAVHGVASVGKTDYNGDVACSDSSDDLEVEVGFSPFMTIEFLKRLEDESVDIEFSPNKNIHGWPTHIKMSKGEYTLFIKSRMAMTSNPVG